MSSFFDKYKKIRKDQKIDLTDIESRTKINVKYLEAIEKGEFDLIQQPYLRLFIRAYINEIGADPNIAIDELTEYLLKKDGISKPNKTKVEIIPEKLEKPNEPIERIEKKNFGDKKEQNSHTPSIKEDKKQFSISPNLIKGLLFIIAWIVIIIIIRNITIDSEPEGAELHIDQSLNVVSNFVDFEQLQSDYIENSSQQSALEIDPPYIVKIISKITLGIVVQQDTLNIESIPMAAGSQYTLYYDKNLDILLKHSNGVSLFVNGETIADIKSQADPVRLTFNADLNIITIKHYSPIE